MVTKTTIADNRRQPVHITGSDNLVTVGAYASVIASSGDGAIYFDASTSHNDIVIKGQIFGGMSGINLRSSDSSVSVMAGAEVTGDNGIQVWALDDISVKNAGVINGLGDVNQSVFIGAGIFLGGPAGSDKTHDVTVVNTGKIFGSAGISLNGDGEITNGKTGTIIGGNTGIFILQGVAEIVNHGVITGNSNAALRAIGDFKTVITNDGIMNGDIDLDGGNDRFDNRGGKVTGQIIGGLGNDTLITDNAKYQLTESANGGLDTVKSTVTYTLSANVEVLALIGKANINGTATDNTAVREYLHGNSGNNELKGLDGNDVLEGGAGKDTLIGGGGLDLFVMKRGWDVDTVKDFDSSDGDMIILYFQGVDDISNLKNRFETHGKDTWLNMGQGDVLILENVDKKDLTNEDFGW